MRIEPGTWVLVLDGEKALVLENVATAAAPNLQVVRKEEQENPPDREQKSDRAGRQVDSAGSQVSAMEETDFHRLEKERFADQMAEYLYLAAHRGRYDRLILVAGPQILGALRPKLHAEVASRVVAEVPKTLTNHPIGKIEKVLVAELADA